MSSNAVRPRIELRNRTRWRFADNFFSVDVLQNPEIRQGIKEYANWPTIPQLYVDGEFVGGSDILTEMYQNGELQKLLQKAA